MSTTIDERVVEMRFDNKQFESNVATSMSTLEKLKQKLNLSGASKGFEDISSAAKKVDMSGLDRAVENVQAKFSALDVVAVTALANITNSAVNAGKNLVKSLTIDQVTAGWKKYEDKTASVQTIMNATGKTIDEVNGYLDKLMWYSDETSYGFNDMTAAIAQMTSSGGDIEKLIPMVEGVANSVAFAGKGAAEFSRVMFNLNQSYGAGFLQLMDWRSVELAGAGSKQLKQVFIDTAIALGKLNKEGKTAKGTLVDTANFSSTLSEKWADTEVMEQAFGRFAKVTEAAYEMVQDETNEIDTATVAYKVLSGELDKTSDEYLSLSESQKALVGTFTETEIAAAKSAQEAKSFTEAIEATKDAVSSGWMKTSELIFGNYEQSKKLWSDVTEQLWEMFASGGETRNDILTDVMTSGWEKIGKVVRKAGIETSDFEKKVTECAKAGGVDVDDLVKKYGSLSDAFKNGAIDTKYLKTAFDSFKEGAGSTSKILDKLSVSLDDIFTDKNGKTQMGLWDNDHESVKKVQTALEELGFTLDKFGVDGLFGSETQSRLKEFQKSVGLEETGIVDQKTIDALQGVGAAAIDSKASIDDLLDSVNRPSGRELVFDIIHNSLESIVSVLGTFRSAWSNVFSEDRIASGLYNGLKAVRDFTEGIKDFLTNESNVEKLTNSFQGLVAVFDVITSLVGGGVKLVFKSLSTIFKAFNFDILGTTSNIGTLLSKFREWVLSGDKIGKMVDLLVNQLSIGIDIIKGWGKSLLDNFKDTKIFDTVSKAVTRLNLAFCLLKEGKLNIIDFVKEIGKFCLSILNIVPIFEKWTTAFNTWLASFKETEAFQKITDAITRLSLAFALLKEGKLTIIDFAIEIGKFVLSILECIPVVKQWIDMFKGWIESFKNLPAVQQFVAAIDGIRDAFAKLLNGDIDFAEFGTLLGENLGKAIKAIPSIIKEAASGIVDAAKQIGSDFIAGFKNGVVDSVSGIIDSIVQFALNFVSAFAAALGVHSPSWKAYQIVKDFFQGAINGAKDALGPVLSVFQKIGEQIVKVFTSLWDYITDESGKIEWGKLIAGGITIESLIILNSFAKSFEKVANALSSFGKIFDGVTKVLNSFSDVLQQFKKTLKAINMDFIAGAAMKLAIAVGILAASVWLIAQVDDVGKLWNAVAVVTVLVGVMTGLAFALSKFSEANVAISKDGVNVKGIQTVLIQIGIAVLLLAATAKLIGKMQPDELKQGLAGLAGVAVGLVLFIAAMGKISKAAGDTDVSKLGTMMLKISAALIVMVIAMKMISKMDPADIVVGIAVLEAFVLFCAQLGLANCIAGQNGQQFGSNVLKIAVAMGVLVIVMKMLSKMDPGDILKGIAVLQAFVILIGEMAIINKLAGGTTSKIGGTVLSMASSMMILAGTLWLLSSMDESAIDNGIKVMQKFVLLIAELTLVSQLGRGSTNIAANILAMSTAIGILAGIAVVLSIVPLSGLAKGIAAVGMLGAIMSLMIWATRGANDVKGNIIAMTVAIGIMAAAVVALSFIDGSKLAGTVATLGTLMIVFGLMTKLASQAQCSKTMIGGILTMIGVVLALTGVIVLLSQLDPKAALPNAIALSTLLLALSAACRIVSKIPDGAGIDGAVELAAFIGIMAGVMTAAGVLSKIPGFNELLAGGGQTLGLIGQAIGNFVGGIVNGVASGLVSIIPQIGEALADFASSIGPFISLVSGIDTSVLTGAGILTGAIIALTAADFIAGIGQILTGGMSFADLGTQLAAFGAGVLAFSLSIKGIDSGAVEAVNSLSAMILTLTASDILSGLKEFFGGGSVNFGELGTQLQQFGEAVVGFSQTISGNIDTAAVQAATEAGKMLVALNESLPRSGGWVQDIIGEKDFSAFATACDAFLKCIIQINNTLSQEGCTIQEEKLAQLAKAGTQFSELNNSLPRSGGIAQDFAGEQDLARFGHAVTAFANCMILINNTLSNPSLVIQSEKLAQLAKAGTQFSDLNNALPRSGGIAQDFAGEQDLTRFGTACKAFADCMVQVNASISQEGFAVNLDGITQLKQAGEKIKELQDVLPKTGGWWQEIAGEQDIGDFGTKISKFATAITDFSTQAKTLDSTGIDLAIQTAYRIKNLVDAIKEIDYSGVGDFTGIGIGQGGPGADGPMHKIGKAIADFSNQVAGIDTEAVNTSVSAARQIRNLITSLVGLDYSGVADFKPEDIGKKIKAYADNVADFDPTVIASSITSANRLRDLITSLVDFDTSGISKFNPAPIGQSMKAYAINVAELDVSSVSASITMAQRLKNFVASLAEFDNSGISKFNVSSIGTSLKSYAASVADFDAASVFVSIAAANRLKTFVSGLADFDSSGITNFKVSQLGSSLNAYAGSVSGLNIDAVTSSVAAATRLKVFIASLAGLDTSGVSSFKTAINELSTVSVTGLTDGFSNAASKLSTAGTQMIAGLVKGLQSGLSSVKSVSANIVTTARNAIVSKSSVFISAGSALGNNLANGISKKKDTISKAATSCVSGAADSIKDYQGDFYDAGSYLVDGLAAGIRENAQKVADEAAQMVADAVAAAKAAADINSPSRVFMKVGSYIPAGFAIGIGMLSGKVEKSAANMAYTAINTTRTAMSNVLNVLNTDIDTQPTIRPVVDLSDVRSGVNSISNLLNTNSSVGVTANLNAVNSMMNNRQNGSTNDDVVSAINKLRKDLGNAGNTTYTVGNITYDDGSNVSEAVKSLVRAARVERRV